MTTNQIAYLSHLEQSRHNRTSEIAAAAQAQAALEQAQASTKQASNAYITARANEVQAKAALSQASTRQAELQYKYDTMPLYAREVAAKELQAQSQSRDVDYKYETMGLYERDVTARERQAEGAYLRGHAAYKQTALNAEELEDRLLKIRQEVSNLKTNQWQTRVSIGRDVIGSVQDLLSIVDQVYALLDTVKEYNFYSTHGD